ncbi:MAG TPA: lyase family protein, partial [Chryseosolibacter sp.]|nr:lyase family protein [Chryseosolibacter sp.]
MQLNTLNAISPVDGRYFESVKSLSAYFSEFGLIRYRVQVEIEYLLSLSAVLPELTDFPAHQISEVRRIYKNFTEQDAGDVKEIEKTTNHDVKAVEYFLKKKFESLKLGYLKEFIHFGLTSQDINNTAIPLSLKDFIQKEYLPGLEDLVRDLNLLSKEWQDIPMLARTHGQPATPTRLGKEIAVFSARLEKQIHLLKLIPHAAKFGGATGNFNAHHVAYPEVDWHRFADE